MDKDFESVQRVFGPDQLQVVRPDLVFPLHIPDRSKQYLLEVGLPRSAEIPGLRFNLLDRPPTLAELLPEHALRIDPEWNTCRFLSLVYDVGFYLSEQDGGTIWEAALNRPDSTFVNSSVELLGWFLAECNRDRPELAGAANADRLRSLLETEEAMRQMDPEAMREQGHFWPTFLEDQKLYLS